MNCNRPQINRPARHRVGRWLAFAGLLLSGVSSALAQSEEGVKAAFIYNFARFTTWPAPAAAGSDAPIKIGFVGADALADTFEKSVADKNINGQKFLVMHLANAAGVENCQIVFIGNSALSESLLKAVRSKPLLTIGDADNFTADGGMIGLSKQGAKIRFDINLPAVNLAHLKLDSRLCQLARNLKN